MLHVLSAGDAGRILELNNEYAVETSLLDPSAAERLLAMCFYAKCVGAGARGFLLALDQDAAYDNSNFQWFRSRFERFVYIDRISLRWMRVHAVSRGLCTRICSGRRRPRVMSARCARSTLIHPTRAHLPFINRWDFLPLPMSA